MNKAESDGSVEDDDFGWSDFADAAVAEIDRRIHFYEHGAQDHAVRETLRYLRSLPVEQRMEAMGMERSPFEIEGHALFVERHG